MKFGIEEKIGKKKKKPQIINNKQFKNLYIVGGAETSTSYTDTHTRTHAHTHTHSVSQSPGDR